MKNYIALTLALSIVGIASANAASAPKSVQVPFVNEVINSTSHEGLAVAYDMNGQPLQRVVCTFYNLYKGWLDYAENGAVKNSNTYGGKQIVIFTSEGKTRSVTETIDQFHSDRQGQLWIHHTEEESKTSSEASVSCFYMPDDSAHR